MPSGERKVRFLMHGQCIARGLERCAIVAPFAMVEPWFGCKLAFVLVLVTVNTERKPDLVSCCLAGRDMA